MELSNDIPRLYTGIAEWLGCLTVLLNCRRRVDTGLFIAISTAAVVLQCGLLVLTAGVDAGILWVCIMGIAFLQMVIFLYLCADISPQGVLYGAGAAFLHAEFAASLEWQLHAWGLRFYPNDNFFPSVLMVVVYAAVFSFFSFMSRRHITENFLKSLTWKEVISISLLIIFTFAFSNLSFFLAGSPFSGRVTEDIFAMRTLADGLGTAVFWGFEISISELLTQKELYSIRHVLSSQYEQFRYYQESEEMLHMMQHDLKHQIEGLRGETNEQKKEEWLDMIENELDKWWLPQRTGNSVFDTILSAKLRRARQLDVRITCVADGALLNCLHVADICTIFGNALDNALESVVMIPDPEKRLIHVSVSAQKNFIFINISNTLGTPLIESENILLTTKRDKKNHGYGIKGIKYVVGKYGGHVSYKADEGWFRLNILIPMKQINT
ncbi:MAG: GHKL domain-containing protein [Lachnospiraceae bacterium]|nr:GHKL domain-containing protein [Lachnospiraceae bacterium]